MTSDFELIMRYASDDKPYIHDPEHTQRPPAGFHKTEKGWSESEEPEHDWTDEEHRKMLDRLYHHVGDKNVMQKWLSKK
jgi:hypothetical protein